MQNDTQVPVIDPNEPSLESLGIDIPAFIDQDLSLYQLRAIVQGGCESGAYMPAVTYYQAAQTMADHGDAVLDQIQGMGPLSFVPCDESWHGFACRLVSMAVECWASSVEDLANLSFEDAIECAYNAAHDLGEKIGGDLSGEWADSMTPRSLMEHVGILDTCRETTSHICDGFEAGAAEHEGDE